MGLIGKTIERVEDRDYHGQRVWFTDGTAADFEPMGYEADETRITERTAEDVKRERIEHAQEVYRRDAERQRAARTQEAFRAEMESMLTPRQYEKWLRERGTAVGFSKVMKREFEDTIKAQMHGMNRQFFA